MLAGNGVVSLTLLNLGLLVYTKFYHFLLREKLISLTENQSYHLWFGLAIKELVYHNMMNHDSNLSLNNRPHLKIS